MTTGQAELPGTQHPFLPNIMCGRPNQCDECGSTRAEHATEYDWANHKMSYPFDLPPIIPIKRQVRNSG